MVSSLNDMVKAIAPTIPSSLISPHALATIGAVAQQFPLTLGTTIGFESPLSVGHPNADFFLRVSGVWGRSLLIGQPQSPPVLTQLGWEPDSCPPTFADLWSHPIWQRIRQFARLWAEPTSLLHTAIDDIWLEFDTADIPPETRADIPLPSIFFGVKSPGLPTLDWIAKIALPALIGSALLPQTQAVLQQCFKAIPASARLFQVGVLSGREPSQANCPALRLYIQNVPMHQLIPLLNQLNWPGDKELLTHLLSHIGSHQDTCTLQLELRNSRDSTSSSPLSSAPSAVLSPVIGIECTFPHRSAWQTVLNRLVLLGFCQRDRAQALLNYPGYVRALDCAGFPPLLKRWSDQLTPYRECLLVKRLAYLKFTYRPNQPFLAKAYLGLFPTWIDARYLTPTPPTDRPLADQEAIAIQVCKSLIQQLDYGEVDIDELFAHQRSQKSRWLNKALEIMCIGG